MISDDEIKALENRMINLENRMSKLENDLPKAKIEIGNKKLSIKEFILSKGPKNDTERTLVLGYYLEKYDNYTSFTAKDLESSFRSAKETVPANINDKVSMNIKRGFMMATKKEKDKRIAWTLTNSGEMFVDSNFGRNNG